MAIQLNTDINLSIHEAFGNKPDDLLSEGLSSFSEHITGLEVHLPDEYGSKKAINDKKCLLEARLEGRQAMAVKGLANAYELAVNSAIDKLNTSLDTILGRLRNY